MSRPQVDVCVVTYNTRHLTVQALDNLLHADQGADLRILVRDNGSGDGTAAAATELPGVTVDAGEENLGFAAGVNTLLPRCEADWVFLLNSDAWPEPGAIGQLVATARRHPRAALVVPRLERPDGTLEHSTHPFPSARVAAVMAAGAPGWAGPRRLERWCIEGHWHHDAPRPVDWAVGAAWLLRREALLDVGGFDERFFMYAEDLEWCWRARGRGWEVWFEPAAVVQHVGNASGAGVYGARRTAAYLRNTYRFYLEEHGVARTLLYRLLNALGATRGWMGDRLRGNRRRAAWWAAQVRVHLSPVRGADGPPG